MEQSQTRFGEAINDLNHHVTMLVGIVQKQEWDIREMKGSLRSLEQKVQSLDGSVQSLERNVLSLRQDVQIHGQGIQSLRQDFQALEQSINSRFEEQDKKFDQILLMLNTLTGKPDQQA